MVVIELAWWERCGTEGEGGVFGTDALRKVGRWIRWSWIHFQELSRTAGRGVGPRIPTRIRVRWRQLGQTIGVDTVAGVGSAAGAGSVGVVGGVIPRS